MIKTQDYC